MKIQDIFNLPKNKGGAKLFQRIMNRYGISKEDSKELKNNIDNSSSGGGSSGVEYYKLNLDKYGAMGNDAPFGGVFYVALGYPCLLGVKIEDNKAIGAYNLSNGGNISNVEQFIEAGFDRIAFNPNIKIIINTSQGLQLNTENVWDYIQHWISLGVSHEDDALIPITEEEFYNLDNSNDSGESTVKEGDLIYYTLNDSFTSIGNITDNITQIAVSRGESMSSGNVGNLNRFVDIQEVTINKEDDYVSISIPNFIVVDMPAFVYKVGSDLKTAEDIIGNSSITRITKEEYDNIFNM